MFTKRTILPLAVCAVLAGCGGSDTGSAPTASSAPAARVPASAMPAIDQTAILDRIKVLSSDEYEGRLPGTKGEELTVRYLVDESKKLGL